MVSWFNFVCGSANIICLILKIQFFFLLTWISTLLYLIEGFGSSLGYEVTLVRELFYTQFGTLQYESSSRASM